MLELHYNFYDKLCDDNIFQELEMDTDFLYLALAEKYLFMYVSFPASEQMGDNFGADAKNNFFPSTCFHVLVPV